MISLWISIICIGSLINRETAESFTAPVPPQSDTCHSPSLLHVLWLERWSNPPPKMGGFHAPTALKHGKWRMSANVINWYHVFSSNYIMLSCVFFEMSFLLGGSAKRNIPTYISQKNNKITRWHASCISWLVGSNQQSLRIKSREVYLDS